MTAVRFVVPVALASLVVATAVQADAADQGGDIYSIRLDGTGRRNLTHDPAFDYLPTPSPDGKRIAFVSNRPRPDIFVMNADGSGLRRLTRSTLPGGSSVADIDAGRLAWSPDGQRIAFNATTAAQGREVDVVTLRGGVTRVARNARNPDWSPNGRLLVVEQVGAGAGMLATIRMDGRVVRRLARVAEVALPDWSSDGRNIAFTRSEFTGETYRDWVAVVKSGGGAVRRITRGSQARWSADGRSLAYVGPSPGQAVVVFRYGSARHRRVGTGAAPVWSRRGTWLAWVSPGGDVVASRPDGTRLRRVTQESLRLSRPPAWLGDGRLVYGLFPN